MALLSRRARAALCLSAVALCACNGHQKVFAAFMCDDPCCGGPTGIDCAEHPDIACVEPGDACTAIAYGCAKGSHYVDAAVPPSCSASSDATPVLVLPDADVAGDAGVASDAGVAGDADANADAATLDAGVPDADAASAGDAGDATVD